MKSIFKQYHYLYKITNLINNKIYIGIHSTDKLDDNYMGTGKHILQAVKKYGKENFKKEILEWFDWKCEALNREAEIVNKEFIECNNTYNIKLGGEQALYFSEETKLKFGKHRKGVSSWNKGLKGNNNPQSGYNHPMYNKKHTEKSLEKMKLCKTGYLNPMSKRCVINNIEYGCAKDAYKDLNIKIGFGSFRAKIRNRYNGWHYLEV